MADFLPCPFCGSAATFSSTLRQHGNVTWSDGLGSPGPLLLTENLVKCSGRGCGVILYADEADAAARWNRRAITK